MSKGLNIVDLCKWNKLQVRTKHGTTEPCISLFEGSIGLLRMHHDLGVCWEHRKRKHPFAALRTWKWCGLCGKWMSFENLIWRQHPGPEWVQHLMVSVLLWTKLSLSGSGIPRGQRHRLSWWNSGDPQDVSSGGVKKHPNPPSWRATHLHQALKEKLHQPNGEDAPTDLQHCEKTIHCQVLCFRSFNGYQVHHKKARGWGMSRSYKIYSTTVRLVDMIRRIFAKLPQRAPYRSPAHPSEHPVSRPGKTLTLKLHIVGLLSQDDDPKKTDIQIHM